jgi:transposase-like protein
MSYVPITPATKTAAVKHYWQTGNLKGTADKFGVSRNTLYEWMRIAELNLEQAFRAFTPGRRTASLAEQNEKLQTQLNDVLDKYHTKSQNPLPAPSLARCPSCQGTKLLRTGERAYQARRSAAETLVSRLQRLGLRGYKKN